MYPKQISKEVFLKIKRDTWIKQRFDSVSVEDLIKTGKLNQFNEKLENVLKENLLKWEKEYPVKIIYQVSNGTQYSSDDEIFMDEDSAVSSILEDSKENLDNFYVLWEFEDGFLPFPSKVFFDGKVYCKDSRYDFS